MKKLQIVFLIAIFMISITSVSLAENGTSTDDSFYEGEKIEVIYKVTEDGLVKVSQEEFDTILKEMAAYNYTTESKNFKSNSTSESIEPLDVITGDWWRYDESYNTLTTRYDLQSRVSNVSYNDTQNIQAKTLSYSHSQGYTLSVSLDLNEFSALKSGVGFTWNNSKSVSSSDTIHLSLGEYGWFEWAPIMNKSVGYVKRFNWLGQLKESKYVIAHSPNEINGREDGLLIGKTSYTSPIN